MVEIEETTNEGGNPTLQIYTEESRRLIGRDGETLEAIQFLLNRLLQARDKNAEKVIVDCEHYRSMREDRIVQRVRELAERVRITGRSLQLEPMNSYERRLVHNAFKDDPEVATWSPSDSARIKQITLLKRQPKKQLRKERRRPIRPVAASLCEALAVSRHSRRPQGAATVCLESRRICAGSRAHFRSPSKFFQQRIVFSFHCVGNDFTQHRRKFESVSAVTRSND